MTSRDNDGLPLIASVDCRSEGKAEQLPRAVQIGGRRWAIEHVREDSCIGSSQGGAKLLHRFVVEIEDGRVLRLDRTLPDGGWRVFLLSG
jgi:hypothetical protein